MILPLARCQRASASQPTILPRGKIDLRLEHGLEFARGNSFAQFRFQHVLAAGDAVQARREVAEAGRRFLAHLLEREICMAEQFLRRIRIFRRHDDSARHPDTDRLAIDLERLRKGNADGPRNVRHVLPRDGVRQEDRELIIVQRRDHRAVEAGGDRRVETAHATGQALPDRIQQRIRGEAAQPFGGPAELVEVKQEKGGRRIERGERQLALDLGLQRDRVRQAGLLVDIGDPWRGARFHGADG
jgi:hypothetical protein